MNPEDIYYSDTRARNLFGYRVADNSMSPAFQPGDIAVVNPNLPGRPGDYVVARRGDETFLRRLDAAGQRLMPLAAGQTQFSVSASDILGRVVEKKRLYK